MSRASSPTTPTASPPSRARRGRRSVTLPQDALAKLAERFVRFREERRRGARVPGDLRVAVLALLRDGVAAGDVYRACGVSWGQVAAWKAASSDHAARAAEPEVPAARVFEVIDDPSPDGAEGGALELRVGRWAVKIRLADEDVRDRRDRG